MTQGTPCTTPWRKLRLVMGRASALPGPFRNGVNMAYTDTAYLQTVNSALTQNTLLLVNAISDASLYLDGRLEEKYSIPLSTQATGSLLFTDNPTDGHTLPVGDVTYRFKDTPVQVNDVTRGASATLSATNLIFAINQRGSNFYTGTKVNVDVAAVYGSSTTVNLIARKAGTWGNFLALDAGTAPVTVTAFSGGSGDYPVLERISAWLAVSYSLAGQAKSSLSSGGGGTDFIDAMTKNAEAWIDMLLDGKMSIIEADGSIVSPKSGSLPTSSTLNATPFADIGDPIYWEEDSSLEWSR